MAREEDVKITIHLELDESDKSAIRNQAKAIKETGVAPITTESQNFGIFGNTAEAGEIKSSRSPFKDITSRALFARTDPFHELKNKIENLEEKTDPESLKHLIGFDPTEFKTLLYMARNPAGFLLQFISTVGLPISVVTAIISSPQMVQRLVDFLTARGGPFDKYFKRQLQNEQNPFLSREQQKLVQIGEQQVIFSQFQGFGNSNGYLTSNTLAQVRANGISDIGLRDKAGGF